MSDPWVFEVCRFFAHLRFRGWRYPLLAFRSDIHSLHHGMAPRAANDNHLALRS